MRSRFLWTLSSICLFTTAALFSSSSDYLIVKLKPGESISRLNRDYASTTIKKVPGRQIYLIQIGEDTDKVLKKIKKDKGVESVERNRTIRLNSAIPGEYSAYLLDELSEYSAYLLDGTTRKSFYGTDVLWSYVDQPGLKLIQVDQVRSISIGAATRVGIIDTGVDTDHLALKPWLDPGIDLVRGQSVNEFDGLPMDAAHRLNEYSAYLLDKRFSFFLNGSLLSLMGSGAGGVPPFFGHGTLVAGLTHVVAPGARILPIKAFDAYGNTTMFTIIDAVYRAMDKDVDILNMSFSTSEDSEAFETAIIDARAAGIAIVASVGNDHRDAAGLYPAAYPGVFAVAATDFHDRLASFSNYGRTVSVTAPGAFVISTVPGGKYAAAWGTSFSAPLVSGTISLLVSGRGQVQSSGSLVVNTADSIDERNPGFERKLGKGRINANQAFKQKN